jgi:5-methylcytosine-specific restriction endonuclease McrA
LAARTASFCSTKCGTDHQWKKKKAEIERGEVSKRTTLKKYLIERDGHRCSDCGATEWKNEPVPVELHHIDGNASNNTVSNMCIICPNCHAMTPNAKGRNKGYGRGTLGIKMN